ncbi:MAG: site-specific DNA-methyltransferase [Candidatus Thermoplasmatota archaeon]|nr:site-specific DNA-methyltransferase [Candidatus Thermoplasmatota archaeon]
MTLIDEMIDTLKKDERLVSDDKLLKNKIIELGLKLDDELISLLLENEKLKVHFFKIVNKAIIFDKEKFMKFVDNKEFLPDSYTTFKNKIGLTTQNEYLTKSSEVVLSWPYKDCVLEGGMEDPEEKNRKEIFWNEILAPDEIDRLFDPKVLTGLKRIDAKGEHNIEEIKTTDNIMIKGNNLLALHSLKKRYAGKIKLIYIDPPYNTGNDEFQYNDSFNYSTWLTFMKNRLEIARELLCKDGAIFIQISDIHVSRLRILLDEIFDNNFINLISIKTRSPSGFKTVNLGVFESAEYILIYAKSKKLWKYITQYEETNYDENYSFQIDNIEENPSNWTYSNIKDIIAEKFKVKNSRYLKKELGTNRTLSELADYALNNKERVFRFTEINIDAGKETLDIKEESLKNLDKVFVNRRDNLTDRYILNGKEITFYNNKVRNIDGNLVPTNLLSNIWTDIPWEGIANEGNVKLKRGKKPEKLLRRIIEMGTDKGDIVLDFFLGSGTTCAVAHKLGRKYLGIEQLDYGKNDSLMRLKNVIGNANSKGKLIEKIENYDQSGISKYVKWEGGGEFIYCELMKWNESYMDKIQEAKTIKDLLAIWDKMKKEAFLSYRIDPKQFDENAQDFKDLDLENQKAFLIECLDKNQLYVNFNEIDDEDYGVSDEDKEINKRFYGVL